jgi:hypothetical protein
VALNGGVIVHPRIIREFLYPNYEGNLNRLVRDVTRGQRVHEVATVHEDEYDDEEGKRGQEIPIYESVMEASEAEEVL